MPNKTEHALHAGAQQVEDLLRVSNCKSSLVRVAASPGSPANAEWPEIARTQVSSTKELILKGLFLSRVIIPWDFLCRMRF